MTSSPSNLASTVLRLAMLACLLGIASCATTARRAPPPILFRGTPDDITIEAIRNARADIAAGTPHVCIAGGREGHPVGVSPRKRHLVDRLPRWELPTGAQNPLLHPAFRFAEIYNTEILEHLEKKP